MAAHGARRLTEMNANLAKILGIELLVAAQGIDLRKRGAGLDGLRGTQARALRTGAALERVIALLRTEVLMLEEDRLMADDLTMAAHLIASGETLKAAGLGSEGSNP